MTSYFYEILIKEDRKFNPDGLLNASPQYIIHFDGKDVRVDSHLFRFSVLGFSQEDADEVAKLKINLDQVHYLKRWEREEKPLPEIYFKKDLEMAFERGVEVALNEKRPWETFEEYFNKTYKTVN